jgi:hypothetical protein
MAAPMLLRNIGQAMIAGDIIDNHTICDEYGVANMGGIRVNKARNIIVLISNNTDSTYRNERRGDVLHFVGMGSKGPQKLDRQNKTLANAKKAGTRIHLFEVFEKSRYVYAGKVELAGEPYMSDQRDARGEERFVWIFPIRCIVTVAPGEDGPSRHLPYGAYAVIGSGLKGDQVKLVNDALDRLRLAGIDVLDQRDVDLKRYEKALGRWHQAVLDQARSGIKELIAKRKRLAKAENRKFGLVDDELKINSASTEQELREALRFLDRDDPVEMENFFEEARRMVPMPDPPKPLLDATEDSPMQVADADRPKAERIDSARFRDLT